jgi:hypothetical protein
MAMAALGLRMRLRDRPPSERALIILSHALKAPPKAPMTLAQLLVDITETRNHSMLNLASGGPVYRREDPTKLLAVLAAGPLHAVYNEDTDTLLWLLGQDLQAHPVRGSRRGPGIVPISGPWILKWLEAKTGLHGENSEQQIRAWLVQELANRLPGFQTFADLKTLKPRGLLKPLCDELVSPREISLLDKGCLVPFLSLPDWEHLSDAKFCSPENVWAIQTGADIVVFDPIDHQWEKATVVGHRNAGIQIRWFYGGKSHLQVNVPYEEGWRVSRVLTPVEATHIRPRPFLEAGQHRSPQLRSPQHSARLPEIRCLFEGELVNGKVRPLDELSYLVSSEDNVPSYDAFLLALVCRSLCVALKKRFPKGFVTALATSVGRMKWALSIDPCARNLVFYNAGASGQIEVLEEARQMGLPISPHGAKCPMLVIPWTQEAKESAQMGHVAQLYTKEPAPWDEAAVDPIICPPPPGKTTPLYTFLHVAAANAQLKVLCWAACKGYKFSAQMLQMAEKSKVVKIIDYVKLKLLPSDVHVHAYNRSVAGLIDAAKTGNTIVLETYSGGPGGATDGCSVPLAALRAGEPDVIEWLVDNDYNRYLAAAAAAHGDMELLQRAIDNHWPLHDALTLAAKRGDNQMVQLLLETEKGEQSPTDKDYGELPASLHAAENGHVDVLKSLKGTAHYAVTDTLLAAAVKGGQFQLRDQLSDMYAPNAKEVQVAAFCGHKDFVTSYVQDLGIIEQLKVQTYAAAAGNLEIVKLCRYVPNDMTWELAAANGHLHVLKWLVEVGYKPSWRACHLFLAAAARINDRATLAWADQKEWRSDRATMLISLYGYEPVTTTKPQYVQPDVQPERITIE